MSANVRFDGPIHDPSPYLRANLPLPCNLCGHDITQHEYLYTLGDVDVYRCLVRHPRCACGEKAEIRGMALAGNPTQADVDAAMELLGRGGGIVVDPAHLR